MTRTILSITLLLVFAFPIADSQDREYFKAKLGNPSEMYHHKSGVNVVVKYDAEGRACSVSLSDPSYYIGKFHSFKQLRAIADELIPMTERGQLLGKTREIGSCINISYENYEQVLITEDENACFGQGIHILYKRDKCPELRSIPGLSPSEK